MPTNPQPIEEVIKEILKSKKVKVRDHWGSVSSTDLHDIAALFRERMEAFAEDIKTIPVNVTTYGNTANGEPGLKGYKTSFGELRADSIDQALARHLGGNV